MTNFSTLCQLNGGCMSCCGHDFISKEKIKEAINQNSKEFESSNPKTEKEFLKFRDRRPTNDLRNGVCRNLIEQNSSFFCPLHPARLEKDLRLGHCDINYLCKTAKEFERWSDDKKLTFIYFIESKNLDNLDYSLRIDNGSLLKEFNDEN